jgi:hypothetical protein
MMLSSIGHNNPPSAIELAEPTIKALNQALKDFPVIANEDEAREAKLILDRAMQSLVSMETERDAQVRPLNEQVKTINDKYRSPRTLLEKVRNILVDRLSAYARKLEAERIAAAEAARAAAAEAERKAREAEEREREAQETAAAGVCDVDIGAASQKADEAFQEFQKADRISQRAEKAMKVRIGGGFGKVSTLRNKEILTVTDWKAAISEMTDDGELPAVISDAILTAARAYRKAFDQLPEGISVSFDRSI